MMTSPIAPPTSASTAREQEAATPADAQAILEDLLLEGVNGPEQLMTADDWTTLRKEAMAQLRRGTRDHV